MKRARRAWLANVGSGDWVEVRSAEEILATLDGRGALEGLPFMPEMLRYCGRRFRVSKSAHKTCDRIERKGLRRLERSVHLEDLRCDGSAHGGCQAGCLLFWKDSWLRKVDGPSDSPRPAVSGQTGAEAALDAHTRRLENDDPEDKRWSCQATELNRATRPLSYLGVSHYLLDVRTGNATIPQVFRWWITVLLNRFQNLPIRGAWRIVDAIRGPFRSPRVRGARTKTPRETLDLVPGEMVEVRAWEEISATIDANARNRGLSFDNEMLPYCGSRHRVLARVERIVDEPTGRMMTFSTDCIILENVVCKAHHHGFCPRAIYPYWREIWLRRVHTADGNEVPD